MIREFKATSRLPYIKLYASDWLNDNASLTDQEIGVYTRMMCRYWMRDGIPWSPEDIAEDMGGVSQERIEVVERILSKRFSKGRGKRWIHRDLDAARTEFCEFKLSQGASGEAGNRVKIRNPRKKMKVAGENDSPIKPLGDTGCGGEVLIKPKSVESKDSCGSPTVTTQSHSQHNSLSNTSQSNSTDVAETLHSEEKEISKPMTLEQKAEIAPLPQRLPPPAPDSNPAHGPDWEDC